MLPSDCGDEPLPTQNAVGKNFQIMDLIVVDRDPQASVVAEQRSERLDPMRSAGLWSIAHASRGLS
jgi:hypothetical protein